jgi:hypothetical protein
MVGEPVPILIKPLLFLTAFGEAGVLFASVIGLACWLLTMLARAISVANFRWLQVSANSTWLHPQPTSPTTGS